MKKHTAPAPSAPPPAGKFEAAGSAAPRNIAGEVLAALRLRWGIVIAVTLLTAVGAWLIASMQPNRYRASAIAAITPVAEDSADQIRGVQALNQSTFVATVAALASTPSVSGQAIAGSGKAYTIRAVVLPSTNLLRIEVDGNDAERTAAIANRVPPILATETRRIFRIYGVTAVSPAARGELIFPRKERAAAAGVIIGILLGAMIAWTLTRPRLGSDASRIAAHNETIS